MTHNSMNDDEDSKIILEKRYSRKITGCMLFVLPIAWLVTGLANSQAYLVGGIFYGLLFLLLLGKFIFSDLSDSENIVITPVGLHLGEGFGSVKIDWNDLGELYSRTHTSTHVSSNRLCGGEVAVETDVIYLKTKGSEQEDHSHSIDFSQWGGRFVKNHMAFYTAERVIEMIKKLRDTSSVKERLKLIKNGKGMSMAEYKKLQKGPFWNRPYLTCYDCGSELRYNIKMPQSERTCPSCWSNEIAEPRKIFPDKQA